MYKRLQGGFLAKYIGIQEVEELLKDVQAISCGLEGVVSLSKRIQRKGYYWPDMKQQADSLQMGCPNCQAHVQRQEVLMASTAQEDWRQPYFDFFIEGLLPDERSDAFNIKRLAKRYFMEGDTLYRKGFNSEPLCCVDKKELEKLLQEVHAGECGEHQGQRKLYYQLLSTRYYWPTMKKDAADFVKKSKTCQMHATLNHKHVVAL